MKGASGDGVACLVCMALVVKIAVPVVSARAAKDSDKVRRNVQMLARDGWIPSHEKRNRCNSWQGSVRQAPNGPRDYGPKGEILRYPSCVTQLLSTLLLTWNLDFLEDQAGTR